MKKLLILLLGVIALLFVLTIARPFFSRAQGCGGILGSNVAANWYRENLEFIRNNAGCSGPIPIEVIITPAEQDNPQLLLDLQSLLIELNFVPTWRPWGNGMPQGEELQAWIDATSVLTIGQFQLFNEPNNCYFGCFSGSTPDPVADAAAAVAFLEASEQGIISIPLALMPLSPRTPDGGNFLSEQTYWTQFNNACGGCVSEFDYIGLNIYPLTTPGADPSVNVNNFINDFNAQLNFFASLGVDVSTTGFLIVEAGLDPGSYAGNFEQRVADTIAFAQALEERILSDPSLFINIDQITFLLMDEAGNQYLVFRQCDAAGNCQWVVEGFLVYNPNVPGWPYQLTCNPSNPGDQDSRPVPCDACNRTDLLTPSCATSFTVSDKVSWEWRDKNEECEGNVWVTREWPEPPPGTIQINPSDTKIPFVGKKGKEDEQKYLADYFEGTNEYYTNADKNYPMYWRDWINYAGVWRKLSPMAYQDQLKKQMVERALVTSDVRPEGVHNYQLEYTGRICWDLPLLMDALIAYAESRGIPLVGPFIKFVYERSSYCVFEGSRFDIWLTKKAIDAFNLISPLDITYFHYVDASGKLTSLEGHYPPDPFEEDYAEKWNEWKESGGGKWYKLWQVVPMFSHEDTPGQISPYLGYKSEDEPKFISPEVEKVPHVARLYEATKEVQMMLTPFYKEGSQFVQNKSEPILASAKNSQPIIASPAEEKAQEEKTLLAQDPMVEIPPEPAVCRISGPMPVMECEQEAITDPNENDDLCCEPINIEITAVDMFINENYTECSDYTCGPTGTSLCPDDPCLNKETREVNREIGITLLHPYLTNIWEQTGLADTAGLFNFFRPEDEKIPEFKEIDASSEIIYSQSGFESIEPSVGKFYFNYLGGVQLAKEWVTRALMPWKE